MFPQTFILFGPSGSGKGTQAKLLIDYLKNKDPDREVLYLETGQRHREFAKSNSLTARKTKKVIERGGLMPEFIPVWLWTQFFIDNVKTGIEHIILDGISRRLHEAMIIDSALQFYERKNPVILSIHVSPNWATDRLMERGRVDDKEKEIARRIEWYEKNVLQVLNHFKNNLYYRFIEINGEQSIEEVHKEILHKVGLS